MKISVLLSGLLDSKIGKVLPARVMNPLYRFLIDELGKEGKRDAFPSEIFETPPIICFPSSRFKVATLVSTRDLEMLVWSLKSLFYFSERSWDLVIMDGGLKSSDVSLLQHHFPNARIFLEADLIRELASELNDLQYLSELRLHRGYGDAHALPFSDNSFDVVCAFGVMHHLADPRKAVFEMLRVARRAVFISDHNDYGRGSIMTRALKQFAKGVGLWNVYKLIVTRGRGYRITDDDGLWYPYSIFDTYESIQPYCSQLHFLNTASAGPNLYRSASHVALLGIMSDQEGQKRF